MRTGFGGDVFVQPHSPREIFEPTNNDVDFRIANWGNAEIAGRIAMNASSSRSVEFDPVEFGPITDHGLDTVVSIEVPLRLSNEAVSNPGLYTILADVSFHPLPDPDFDIPTQTVEVVIDTRPLAKESSEVNTSPTIPVVVLLAIIALIIRHTRPSRR
ncbi:MAG: hypothetical protein KY455_02090 [Euryarchaeota archaeon]|nr:hypothetical protein [Euryarchaeota archaeon]